MHVDFITIGDNWDVNKTMSELNAQKLKFSFFPVDANGKFQYDQPKVPYAASIGIREIRLWDVTFPEPYKDVVLNTIFGAGEGKIDLHETSNPKKYEKYLWALRKALRLQPIPEYKKDLSIPIYKRSTHFLALGIKPDRFYDGAEML